MFQNNNGAVVRRLTDRSLRNDRKRNFFIIIAITLTTLLLGFVFSLGMSLMESRKMEEIRFAGTMAHAAIGHPTVSQLERLEKLDYVQVIGTATAVAFVKNTPQLGKTSLSLYYFDKTEWEKLRAPTYTDIVGNYPQKENEVMVSLGILEKLGITNPSIGMEIPIAYYTKSGHSDTAINKNFRLSGWFKSYALITSKNMADTILVSKEFSQKCRKTVETDGFASVVFNHSDRVLEYCQKIKQDLGLSKNQPVAPSQLYDTNENSMRTSLIALSALIAFFILTGYLLIYNVLYISVSRDVRFYGLLKTLGTTPRQIRRIVTGQIMQLCMIGIPVGILLSLLLSRVAVPVFISKLGVVSTVAVVSFSPLIYLGATFFSLLTALLGALKPAKMAARISPVEAQKFTEINDNKSHAYRSAVNGKPYKMAIRNIFRDRKRAAVVLLSLFLGVTTFITVTTLVSSMGIKNYVNSIFDSDFMLKNNTLTNFETDEKQKFNNEFIEKVKSLPGVENLRTITHGWERLDYNSQEYGPYIADFYKQKNIAENLTEENIQKNFWGSIVGIDRDSLIKINHTLQKPIDVDAFERGEFALIATDHPDLFSSVHELTISPLSLKGAHIEEPSGSVKTKIPLGGFVPFSFDKGGSMAPTILVSNSFMTRIYQEPILSEIDFDVAQGHDQQVLAILKQMTDGDQEMSLTSKLEMLEELNNAKIVLYVLGGGIALIIALIGILNFVNVMSVGIMVRRHELATLEAVGMNRKQVRKLLASEGLGYAIITLFLVFTIGNLITFGIFTLFHQQATYSIFTYPFIPVLFVGLVIIVICIVIPQIEYRSISKTTIVERLMDTE